MFRVFLYVMSNAIISFYMYNQENSLKVFNLFIGLFSKNKKNSLKDISNIKESIDIKM